jgi:hypothetical protein
MNSQATTRRDWLIRLTHSEAGGSLPGVLVAIALGSILMAPFLSQVSTSMLAVRAAGESTAALYAADSGVEYAVWRLDTDSAFRNSVLASLGSPVAVAGNPSINGVATSVTVTAEQDWLSVASAPAGVGDGGSLTRISGSLFALRGGNTRNFWRYDIASDSWTPRALTPNNVGEGGALTTRDGDTLFALRGGDTTDFWRYRPSSNSWTARADTPRDVNASGSLAYLESGETYAFMDPWLCVLMFCLDRVWRYREGPDSWDFRDRTPDTTGAGAALTADGSGALLAFQGNGTGDFWSYTPNNWQTSPADPPSAVGVGADLTSDEVQYTYALRGGGTRDAWRYDRLTNSWSDLPDTPAAVGPGGSIVYAGNDTVYALRGGGSTDFWMLGITYVVRAYQGGDLQLTARVSLAGANPRILLWDIE